MGRVNIQFLRRMVRGGMSRKSSRDQIKEGKKDGVEDEDVTCINWAWKYTNENILNICHAETIQEFTSKVPCVRCRSFSKKLFRVFGDTPMTDNFPQQDLYYISMKVNERPKITILMIERNQGHFEPLPTEPARV